MEKSWTKLCSLLQEQERIWWNVYGGMGKTFFGFNVPLNRITSPWTSVVERACSIELVLIFQKSLQSNVIASTQLSQGRVIEFHPGTLYQSQEERALPYNTFVVQTLVSTVGKADIWNLRPPKRLWQALSGNPPSCCSRVGGCQTLFLGF